MPATWSGWKQGPTFKVNVFQESDSAVIYTGTWSTQNIASASGGSLRHASAAGDSAKLDLRRSALNFAWIAPKGADRGKAEAWVDGVAKAVDLYSSTLQVAQVGLRQERPGSGGGAHPGGRCWGRRTRPLAGRGWTWMPSSSWRRCHERSAMKGGPSSIPYRSCCWPSLGRFWPRACSPLP